MRTSSGALIGLTLAVSLAAAPPAVAHESSDGVTFYVNAKGIAHGHAAPGTQENPFTTIGAALQAAQAVGGGGGALPWVTISVASGSYAEDLNFGRANILVIAGAGASAPVITGANDGPAVNIFASNIELHGLAIESAQGISMTSTGYGSGQPYPSIAGVVIADCLVAGGGVFDVGGSVTIVRTLMEEGAGLGMAGSDSTLTATPRVELIDSVLTGPFNEGITVFESFEQVAGSVGAISLFVDGNQLSGALANPPPAIVSDGHLIEIAARLGDDGETTFDVVLTNNEFGTSDDAAISFIGGAISELNPTDQSTRGRIILAGNHFRPGGSPLVAMFDYRPWEDVAMEAGIWPSWIWNATLTVEDPDGSLGRKLADCSTAHGQSAAFCLNLGPADHGNQFDLSRQGPR